MQKIMLPGITAALTAAFLFAAPNIGASQTLEQAAALDKEVTELVGAGKYEKAIPLIQRVLSN
jgi:hypothetical protein